MTYSVRRIASWILTLPEPFEAQDPMDAHDCARRKCDPALKSDDFEGGLSQLGYKIVCIQASRYTLAHTTLM